MKSVIPKFIQIRSWLFLAITILLSLYISSAYADDVTIIDARHYSKVLGESRNYRIFLPPGYFDNPEKKYPVIYFFHGWSQRYFGGVKPYSDFDKGEENNGDNIANFVSGHDVIIVKADGYNRSVSEKYYLRPWNVSPVETHRQFPLYFPELVDHIDSNYRTIADREHRGISGLSMGGFMTFWIGGKYPDLLSAAGNFCGSPEFKIGPKDFPVEYRHIDMYKNFGGVSLRLNYGDKDFIKGYHQDMNRVWPQLMDDYEFEVYDAGHSTCGMGDMFSFILKTFENPPPIPAKWHHTDVYPQFSVWDYHVTSDRTLAGFTVLENVDKRGFRCAVRNFVPDGELIPAVNLSVTTAPIYEKNQPYIIHDIDARTAKATRKTIVSDQQGRLVITMNGSSHEIGINKQTDKPNIGIASVEIGNMPWATHNKEIMLSVKLLNKGLSAAKNITAELTPTRKSSEVTQARSTFRNIDINEIQAGKIPFKIRVRADSIEVAKFKLTLRDNQNNEWTDYFDISFKKNVPEIKDFFIADGKSFTVSRGGKDSVTVALGKGNGDGVANPGESIIILVRDQNRLWRTDLTFSDRFINPFGVNVRKSDNWSSLDNVGGSAKYDVPLISSDCPDGHPMEFFVEYWLPEYPLHIIRQGIVKLKVTGKDQTPPQVDWIQLPGGNTLEVKISDGAKIQSVKARLTNKDDSKKSLEVELKDDGLAGDRVETDHVFSKKIPEQTFGIYTVEVVTTDSIGNKTTEASTDEFVLY